MSDKWFYAAAVVYFLVMMGIGGLSASMMHNGGMCYYYGFLPQHVAVSMFFGGWLGIWVVYYFKNSGEEAKKEESGEV